MSKTAKFISIESPPRVIQIRKDLIIAFMEVDKTEVQCWYYNDYAINKDGELVQPVTRIDVIGGKSYYVFGEPDTLSLLIDDEE